MHKKTHLKTIFAFMLSYIIHVNTSLYLLTNIIYVHDECVSIDSSHVYLLTNILQIHDNFISLNKIVDILVCYNVKDKQIRFAMFIAILQENDAKLYFLITLT